MAHTPNWQERARRAEMIAERLADSLTAMLTKSAIDRQSLGPVGPVTAATFEEMCRPALDAWHQHRADLDTLAQAQQEGR